MYLQSSESASFPGFMLGINNEQACKRASLMPAISLLIKTITISFIYRYGEIRGGKRHCISRRSFVFVFELFYGWEKLGTSGSDWLADSRFLVLVTFMNLFLCQRRHSDSDGYAPNLYFYTQNLYFAPIIVGLVLDGNGNLVAVI